MPFPSDIAALVAQRLPLFRCDCGTIRAVLSNDLMAGRSASCGCATVESSRIRMTTHGKSKTPEYKAWCLMKARCLNPSSEDFALYGGRGIEVCGRWLEGDGGADGFECFLDDMGPKPHPRASIDRIDPNGNYEPGNCRWASPVEQANNKRTNVLVVLDGETVTLAEAARRRGANYKAFAARIRRGMPLERALELSKARLGPEGRAA